MANSLDPSAILGQLTEGYVKLPLIQKVLFPVLIVASVMGIIYVSKWANSPEYVVLYSDLDAANSGAVIERLKEQKIKYEVRGDGSTIAISPPDMIHELRLTLAAEGLPKAGTVGLEIFEATNLGSTTFQERVKWIRAIQGELERTISSLDAVKSARVHITQPEKSVFANRSSVPTASVMLRMRPGGELEKSQVKGIAHLVAGSVEGLEAESVSIIDVHGNLLTTPEDEAGEMFQAEATRLQYQREVEQGYARRIEQMLMKVLGHGKAIARVSAELDFSVHEREEESYDPGGQVLRSERSIEEGIGTSQRGGIPGVVSNLTEDPGLLTATEEGGETSRNESVRNYEISRAVTRTSAPRGVVRKLSVAVLVDGSGAAAVEEADKDSAFVPLDDETLQRIEAIVKSAVGYDPARGDTVTVENIPFSEPPMDYAEAMDQKATQDLIFNSIFRAGPLLFLFLFFFIIVKPLVKFLVTPTEAEVDLQRLLPTGIKELESELEAERAKASVPKLEPSIDLDQLEELMAENSRIVKENPAQAALLIRYWLNDGRL